MNKTLIKSEKDYVNFFVDFVDNDIDMSFEAIESLLGIEFAFEDGNFPNDIFNDIEINEDQDIDTGVYRKREDCLFPEHYPCVMVYHIENEWDRFGDVEFRMFEFVYLQDFKGDT